MKIDFEGKVSLDQEASIDKTMFKVHEILFDAYLQDIDVEAHNLFPIDFKFNVTILDDEIEDPLSGNDNAYVVTNQVDEPASEGGS